MENQMTSRSSPDPISSEHIQVSPAICGGKACIAGTRIRVQDVYVWHEIHGLTADDIVSNFPHITLADVHAALAYFWDHREELERQMKADDDFVDVIKSKNPSRVKKKLKSRNAKDSSLPS